MNDNTNEFLKEQQLITSEKIGKKDAFIAFPNPPKESEKLLRARRVLTEGGQRVGSLLIVADSSPWENVPGSLKGSWEITSEVSPYVQTEEKNGDENDNLFDTLMAHKANGEILVSFGKKDLETDKLIFTMWYEVQLPDLAAFNLETIKDATKDRKDIGELLLSKEQLTTTIFQFI